MTGKRIQDSVSATGRERPWPGFEVIVTKTDSKGIITEVNDTFLEMAGLTEAEVIGAPHNIIRHPYMPHCVFKLMWDMLRDKKEVFAFVVNMSSNGDHYWTFANVRPVLDAAGEIVGYESRRMKARPAQIDKIKPVYDMLNAEEAGHESLKDGMDAGLSALQRLLDKKHMTYNQFVFSI